jgi:hypothetical protein
MPNPQILQDAYISVGGTAISNMANSVTIAESADNVEVTAFSTSGFRQYAVGLRTATVTVDLFQDFSAGTLSYHTMLRGLYLSGGTFALVIRPTSPAAGTANPSWTMTSRLYSYSPLSGKVGDASAISLTFQNAGTAGLVEALS